MSAPDLLVIGRQGQLARSLAERAGHWGLFPAFAARPALDLADEASIRRAIAEHPAPIVVNAAAYTAVDQAEAEAALAERINAAAAGTLAQAAADAGARLIHVSTDYVFDGRSAYPYDESVEPAPINAYGRSKLAGEEAVRAALPAHAIVRSSWVYSPFGRNFVRTMLDLGASRDLLRVVDDQVGTPTSALDLADALLAIARAWRDGSDTGLGEIYHVAGSGETSWAGFAREIFRHSRASGGPSAEVEGIATEDWPAAAARPRNSRLSSAKFARDFGITLPAWQDSSAQVVERLLAG
ncbi:MAG: dTDP-4-dehydrorhamnose reductase [Sphingomonadales bacterium]